MFGWSQSCREKVYVSEKLKNITFVLNNTGNLENAKHSTNKLHLLTKIKIVLEGQVTTLSAQHVDFT